jgi:hypothetical protein
MHDTHLPRSLMVPPLPLCVNAVDDDDDVVLVGDDDELDDSQCLEITDPDTSLLRAAPAAAPSAPGKRRNVTSRHSGAASASVDDVVCLDDSETETAVRPLHPVNPPSLSSPCAILCRAVGALVTTHWFGR